MIFYTNILTPFFNGIFEFLDFFRAKNFSVKNYPRNSDAFRTLLISMALYFIFKFGFCSCTKKDYFSVLYITEVYSVNCHISENVSKVL